MAVAYASLEAIKVNGFEFQHPTDPDSVASIVSRAIAAGQWVLPPIVALENEGYGCVIFDGHHRCTAAQVIASTPDLGWTLVTIPAWIVPIHEYCKVVEAHFGGSIPNDYWSLRDHIICGNVNANSICEHGRPDEFP